VTPRFVAAGAHLPAAPGAYVLMVELTAPLDFVFAGKPAHLAPGAYFYCGSARGPGGLAARVGRHLRGDECALARGLSHLPTPLPGFGASDCKTCRSHLFQSGESCASLLFERTWECHG
jgi:histidyl-tRNA synthetase